MFQHYKYWIFETTQIMSYLNHKITFTYFKAKHSYANSQSINFFNIIHYL